MKLVDDWQSVLKKAWSVKLIVLAALFSGAEVVLPYFADAFPHDLFAALSGLTASAALVARICAQKPAP
jgi:hypothetical protein